MEPVLRLHGVRHTYNGRTVLDIGDLEIPPGSITGLAGPNGSGKSTLLKILALAQRCSAGTVYFRNLPVQPFAREARQRITLLPQETYLLRRSVFDNIAYGLKIRKEQCNLPAAVSSALDLVGLPASFAGRHWHELSGGEAQRVALAARLALKPACLLLDEPTASVDMESARCIRRAVLLARREWGTTLLIASHHQAWLNDICDRLIFLYNGRILDCSYENVLLGPWSSFNDDLVVMTLTDGQLLYLQRPPLVASSAVFAPEALRLDGPKQDGEEYSLSGLISGIFVDSQSGRPLVHVVCGDQRFVVSAAEDIFSTGQARPGKEVSLYYNPGDISWLPG